jgi:recombinational DNA repair protein (RecF pathway)
MPVPAAGVFPWLANGPAPPYGMLFAELLLYTATDTEEDSEAFYGLIKEGLRLLQACPEDGVVAFALQYQLQWLESAGYHPVLDACLYTGEPLDDSAVYYCFSPSLGGIATPAQKKRLQESSGVAHSEWVNVSTSTLRLLREPTGDWSWEQRLKAQRFLRYYFSRAFERNLRAYELVLNLLTPAATASADLQSREVALEPTQV